MGLCRIAKSGGASSATGYAGTCLPWGYAGLLNPAGLPPPWTMPEHPRGYAGTSATGYAGTSAMGAMPEHPPWGYAGTSAMGLCRNIGHGAMPDC